MASLRLIALDGELAGRSYLIEGTVTIGRHSDSTIPLNDSLVSRFHARITTDAGFVQIEDLESSNGTFVNGHPISRSPLQENDEVVIGETRLHVAVERPFDALIGRNIGSDIVVDYEIGEIVSQVDAQRTDLFNAYLMSEDPIVAHRGIEKFQLLYAISKTLSRSGDVMALFVKTIDSIFDIFPVDRAAVLVTGEDGKIDPEPKAMRIKGVSTLYISRTLVDAVLESKQGVLATDSGEASGDDKALSTPGSMFEHGARYAMCAPIMHEGKVLGVIYVDTIRSHSPFEPHDLDLLIGIGGQVGTIMRRLKQMNELELQTEALISSFAIALESRDVFSAGHGRRVTACAMAIAEELGQGENSMRRLRQGGLLHDIGEINIPYKVLGKTSSLDDNELTTVRRHPELGANLITQIRFLRDVIPIVLCHHEYYDGAGYPHGLAGREIPMEARVMAVAEAFDGMTRSRPHRKAFDPGEAIIQIQHGSGEQFDPTIVEAFMASWESGELLRKVVG